jgi:hypothetical protein
MIVCCSILNSVVIVMFLSGMVAMIMLRTLHKDIARYNQLDNSVRDNLSPSISSCTPYEENTFQFACF